MQSLSRVLSLSNPQVEALSGLQTSSAGVPAHHPCLLMCNHAIGPGSKGLIGKFRAHKLILWHAWLQAEPSTACPGCCL